MMHDRLDVSVVIAAYTENRWDDLVGAVESLQCQTVPPHEIVVVIDHNKTLFERTRQHMPDVVVVENREIRGLSGARNTGVAVAQGTVIAFLDDDAVAAPDWLANLSAAYDDPKVIGVGGPVNPMWLAGRPQWFPEEFDWVVGCTFRGMPLTTMTVPKLIGCNMSFRSELFESVGVFRHGIGRIGTRPLASEETELCLRTGQQLPDSIMVYEPSARVEHKVPGSRASWAYFRSRCYCEGLSKALVARLVGADDGLATERTYVLRTLPGGVLRGLADTLQGEHYGLARAAAIIAGLAITTAGYVAGTVLQMRAANVGSGTMDTALASDRGL